MPTHALAGLTSDQLTTMVLSNEPTKALEVFYDRYKNEVLALIVTSLRHNSCNSPWEHGWDILHDSFIDIYKRFEKIREDVVSNRVNNPRSWVRAVAVNHSFDHFKKECSKREVQTGNGYESDNGGAPTFDDLVFELKNRDEDVYGSSQFERNYENRQTLSRVGKYINNLSATKRAVMLMYLNGYSNKEIAETLRLTESNVRAIVSRTNRDLKKKFDGGI